MNQTPDQPQTNSSPPHHIQRWLAAGYARLLPVLPFDVEAVRGRSAAELDALRGKAPGYKSGIGWALLHGWQKTVVDGEFADLIANNYPEANAGLLLGHGQVAADLDIKHPDDEELCQAVIKFVFDLLGKTAFRSRDNSPSRLLLYAHTGRPGKVALKFTTANGHSAGIELLAFGQQAVVAGTHPTGVELIWHTPGANGSGWIQAEPQADQLAAVTTDDWAALPGLLAEFLTEAGCELGSQPGKPKTTRAAATDTDEPESDPLGVLDAASSHDLKPRPANEPGKYFIECPWQVEHTQPQTAADTSTCLMLPGPRGYQGYGFACLHAHCEAAGRNRDGARELLKYLGVDPVSQLDATTAVKAEKPAGEPDCESDDLSDVEVAAAIRLLSQLGPIQYERRREREAKRLGMRVSMLDDQVKKERGDQGSELPGRELTFETVEPCAEPVILSQLLDDIAETLTNYVLLPDKAADVLALWVAFTWCIDAFGCAPILLLTSPERRCGKSRTKDVLKLLVKRPFSTANISPASLFRISEQFKPTIMFEEGDNSLRNQPELLSLINAGFDRGEVAVRIEGEGKDRTPRAYDVFGARLIVMIGLTVDTTVDRSIVIPLRRKLPSQKVDRLIGTGKRKTAFPELLAQLAWLGEHHKEVLAEADPAMPEKLDDRERDKYRPLFAIADLAGPQWAKRARSAAELFSALVDEDSLGVELLKDIKGIFEARTSPEAIPTSMLLGELTVLDGRPWAEIGRTGKPLTSTRLARMLKRYAIKAKRPLPDEPNQNTRGYFAKDFSLVFAAYVTKEDGET